MTDTHVHLNDPRLCPRVDEITEEFDAIGMQAVVNVSYDLESADAAAEQAKRHRVYCALGFHPSYAAQVSPDGLERLERLIRSTDKCLAVGEIGLDYYYPEPPRQQQKELFEAQMQLAERLHKPVILHIRDAYADSLDIVKRYRLTGIAHCYSGSAETAKILTDLGYYIAFGGAITFKNNVKSADVIRAVPLDRLLVETDCPYLSPVPYRGKTNEPKYVRYVLEKMAEVLGKTVAETEALTDANFRRLFGIA